MSELVSPAASQTEASKALAPAKLFQEVNVKALSMLITVAMLPTVILPTVMLPTAILPTAIKLTVIKPTAIKPTVILPTAVMLLTVKKLPTVTTLA